MTSPAVPWWASFRTLLAASAVEAAALVPFHYLPIEDSPTNVGSAHIIATYPGSYGNYFKLDFLPKFDMLWQFVLSLAARVMPTLVAERIMIVLLVIGLPLAGWYADRGIRDDGGPAAFLLLPLSIGFFFHAGYHGFCLGVVLCLVSLGWWLRHKDGDTRSSVVLALLLALTYTAHVFGLAMALGFIAVVTVWDALTGDRSRVVRRLLSVAAAAAPAIALLLVFVVRGTGESGIEWLGPSELVKNLVSMRPVLGSFDSKEALVSLFVALSFLVLSAFLIVRVAPRSWRDPQHAWLAATLATVVLYFVAPAAIGEGGQINERIAMFALVVATLWFASLGPSRRVLAAIVTVGIVSGFALTVLHVPKYRDFDRDIQEFTSVGDRIPAGSTVAPVFLVQPVDPHDGLAQARWIRPLIQATGYLVDEHDAVDLSQFNGQLKFFITQFRDDVDPLARIPNHKFWLDQSPPDIDLRDYEERTGGKGRVDYVVVWGENAASDEVTSSPVYRELRAQIDEGFELVYTSERGHAQLYQRRGSN